MNYDFDDKISAYVFLLMDQPLKSPGRVLTLKRVYIAAPNYTEALWVAKEAFNEQRGSLIRFVGSSPIDVSMYAPRGYFDASAIDFDPLLDTDTHTTYPFVRVLSRQEKIQELLLGC